MSPVANSRLTHIQRFISLAASILLLSPVFSLAVESTDWPAWRGPRRDGRSDETGLLAEWPEGGPKLLWKSEGMGEGYSTPSVAGEFVYMMGNKDGYECVVAVDRTKQGTEGWVRQLGPVRAEGGGYRGPRSTPTVDGSRLYALGLAGDLVCLDAKTGKVFWRHDLIGEFGGQVGGWGYAESPLVDDGVAPLNQLFRDLRDAGFCGTLSLELFNRTYWEQDAFEVVRTGLEKTKAAVQQALEAS